MVGALVASRKKVRIEAESSPKPGKVPDLYVRLTRGARPLLVIASAAILLPAGALMLVLPGPGLLVIGAGLALLASEFPIVRTQLHRAATIAGALHARLKG